MSGNSGDTQVLSQSAVDSFKVRSVIEGDSTPGSSKVHGATATATQRTLVEGDTGHIDILGVYEEEETETNSNREAGAHESGTNSEDDADSILNDDEHDQLSLEPVHTEPFPESQRFKMPKTPATGRKRDYLGQVVDSAAKSGGKKKGLMGLSQAFGTTSSPLAAAFNVSDPPFFDRPSPHFDIQIRPVGTQSFSSPLLEMQKPIEKLVSSPMEGLRSTAVRTNSSPVKLPSSTSRRAQTEPRSQYETMSQSQRRREAHLAEKLAQEGGKSGNELDDLMNEEDELEREFRLRRLDREWNEEFSRDMSKTLSVKKRSPRNTRGIRKSDSTPGPKSARRDGRSSKFAVELSDEPVADDDEPKATQSEAETEQEDFAKEEDEEMLDDNEGGEEDKENISTGIQVPATTVRTHAVLGSLPSPESSPSAGRQSVARSQGSRQSSRGRSQRSIRTSQQHLSQGSTQRLPDQSQMVAIADSQPSPSQLRRTKEVQRDGGKPHPSSHGSSSFVPQSQAPPARSEEHDRVALIQEKRPVHPDSEGYTQGGPQTSDSAENQTPVGDGVEKSREDDDEEMLDNGITVTGITNAQFRQSAPEHELPYSSSLHGATTLQSKSSSGPKLNGTIPETSPAVMYNRRFDTQKADRASAIPAPRHQRSNDQRAAESNGTTTYDTAPTHRSSSPIKEPPLPPPFAAPISDILQSPSGKRRRGLVDIASDSVETSPSKSIDMNVFNLITDEDRQVQAIIDGSSPVPAHKRRRLYKDRVLERTQALEDLSSSPGVSGPKPSTPGATRATTPIVPREEEMVNGTSPHSHSTESNAGRRQLPSSAPPPSSGISSPPPSSADQREQAGARAASAARQAVRERKITSSNSAAGHAVDDATPHTNRRAVSHSGRNGRRTLNRSTTKPLQLQNRYTGQTNARVGQPTQVRKGHSPRNVTSPDPLHGDACGRSEDLLANSAVHLGGEGDKAEKQVVAPDQIIAECPGFGYYPGIYLGAASGDRVRVQFQDTDPVTVPRFSVKRLALREGDTIKVDMPNLQKKPYVVVGLRNKLDADAVSLNLKSDIPVTTDVYGHTTVLVALKRTKSMDGNDTPAPIAIPIANICLDRVLWNRFQKRDFTPSAVVPTINRLGLNTPSERPSTPSTPSMRNRRQVAPNLNHSATSSAFSISITAPSKGIFSNMLFAVSYLSSEPKERERIATTIQEHGGTLIREDFSELFHSPDALGGNPSLPSKQLQEGNNTSDDTPSLKLTATASEFGFVALISDRHHRKEKYLQALALNIPCLSGMWITKCVKRNKILDWEPYLLPAGDSFYLDGATRSRTLTPYHATEAKFAITTERRPTLLEGKSVLLLKGKGEAADKRRPYVFLSYALGARKVERSVDVTAAKDLIDTEGFDYVYAEEKDMAALRKAIGLPDSDRLGSRGRKSGSVSSGKRTARKINAKGMPRVVSHEFVAQTLILGRLLDEEDSDEDTC